MGYYTCVLAVGTPAAVELGKPASFYRDLLANRNHLLALPSAPAGVDGGEDDGERPLSTLALPSTSPMRPRSARLPDMLVGDALEDSEVLPPLTDQVLPPLTDQPARSSSIQHGGDLDLATSSGDRKRPRPQELEGQQAYVEEHGLEGQPGYYKRLVIQCPLSSSEHVGLAPCCKKRNMGQRQTARFGHLEPYGYLGAWASAAASFASRADHMSYRPPLDAVERYMRERAWLE